MRIRLYHNSQPAGKIYTDEESLNKAINDGWVDAPWKVNVPDIVKLEIIDNGNMPKPKRPYKRHPANAKRSKPKRDADSG